MLKLFKTSATCSIQFFTYKFKLIPVCRTTTNKTTNDKELEQLGNRIRLLIENSYIIHKSKKIYVTISIGATIVKENDTIDDLLKRADTLLYRSKATGRNCLTID